MASGWAEFKTHGVYVRLYGFHELATRLGKSKQMLSHWRRQGRVPDPIVELHSGPVWLGENVDPWISAVCAGGIPAPGHQHCVDCDMATLMVKEFKTTAGTTRRFNCATCGRVHWQEGRTP